MSLLRISNQKPIQLQLRRDLVRSIKRGHCWIYKESLRSLPQTKPGTNAILLDNRGGREIGRGYYDPNGQIALRICTTKPGEMLNEHWAVSRMQRAINLRLTLFDERTTGYRLFNGEGDGLPGLVCDRYTDVAVIKFDGQAARKFWNAHGIAQWLADRLGLKTVYERIRDRHSPGGHSLFGPPPKSTVNFLEHSIRFTANIIEGQKTGFYLDQRENRRRMQKYVPGKRVLNIFGYTGGFSVYAGKAGAAHVTTVDTAMPALVTSQFHWTLNNLPVEHHSTVCADAFDFLNNANTDEKVWDVVILDPPSFAPSKEAVPKALITYKNLIAKGTSITERDGILAVSSCSSHITMEDFISACQDGIGKARRQATTLGIFSQPADHPAPLAMPEFRYLKFVIMRVS